VDAVLFPMLPEAFVVLFYSTIPTVDTRFSPRTDIVLTAALVLFVVLAAEVAANGLLYALMKAYREKLPRRLERAMNKWREFLIFSDERVVLLNRVVPVMPFTGAFIAVSPWSVRRAMGYLVLGGALKYGFLISVVALAGLWFDPRQTWWLSLGLVIAVLTVSFASHGYLRRRVRQKLHLPHHHPHAAAGETGPSSGRAPAEAPMEPGPPP